MNPKNQPPKNLPVGPLTSQDLSCMTWISTGHLFPDSKSSIQEPPRMWESPRITISVLERKSRELKDLEKVPKSINNCDKKPENYVLGESENIKTPDASNDPKKNPDDKGIN